MKKLLFVTFCLTAILSNAQEKADILVSYDFTSPNLRTGEVSVKDQYILLANSGTSKFFSPPTEYIDSLNSTPTGKAALRQMTAAAIKDNAYDKIPQKGGSFYVTRSAAGLRTYDNAGTEKYVVEEAAPGINWEISDSVKTIIGYECIKAVADFHGRRWTVWFSPEIPIQAGPWKLIGLPGLILEAEADSQYKFEATGLEQSRKTITPVFLADTYEKTSRRDFLKSKRSFIDNPLGMINAQFQSENESVISVIDENGNSVDITGRLYVTRDVADFLETDY